MPKQQSYFSVNKHTTTVTYITVISLEKELIQQVAENKDIIQLKYVSLPLLPHAKVLLLFSFFLTFYDRKLRKSFMPKFVQQMKL